MLFPFRKPDIGINFSSTAICASFIRRSAYGHSAIHIQSTNHTPISPGLLNWSYADLMITDESSAIDILRHTVPVQTVTPVAIGLPTTCASIGMFEFDQFPSNAAEQRALIRWRLRDTFEDVSPDSHMRYHVWPIQDASSAHKSRVLAFTIRPAIIDRVSQLCEQCRLLPITVGIQGTHLYDLCRPIMTHSQSLVFASNLDEEFFFVATHHGIPYFIRSKPLSDRRLSFSQELSATLDYVSARYDQFRLAHPALELFVLDDNALSPSQPVIPPDTTPGVALEPQICFSMPVARTIIQAGMFPIGWPDPLLWPKGLSSLAAVTVA